MLDTSLPLKTLSGILYLLLTTAFAAYLTFRTLSLSLPIPSILLYTTTFLPLLSGISVKTTQYLNQNRHHRRRRNTHPKTTLPTLSTLPTTLILLLSTILLTLLGSSIHPLQSPPGTSDCTYHQTWLSLFTSKNAAAIRLIQDSLTCCGLRNAHDMAWPFPDRTHGADACEVSFGRVEGCLEGWKGKGGVLVGWMMVCVGLVGGWVIFMQASARDVRFVDADGDEAGDGDIGKAGRAGRAIDYTPEATTGYSDRIEEEESDGHTHGRGGGAIEPVTVASGHGNDATRVLPLTQDVWRAV